MPPESGSQNRIRRCAAVVLPAPDGPTSATVRPAGTVKVAPSSASRRFAKYENVTSRTSISMPAGRGETSSRGPGSGARRCSTSPGGAGTSPHGTGGVTPSCPASSRYGGTAPCESGVARVAGLDVPRARRYVHPGTVPDRLRLVVHRVEPARGAQGVGELPADVCDLRHRQERRHREQGEHRQDRRVQRPAPGQARAGHHHHQPPEAGRRLQDRGLLRQIGEEGQPQRGMALDAGHELRGAGPGALEGDDLREPLDAVHGVRVHVPERLAGPRSQRVDTVPRQEGAQRHHREEGEQGQRHRPPEPPEGPDDPRPERAPRRRRARRYARRSTPRARRRSSPSPPDRRCAGAGDKPARAGRASRRARCASPRAFGTPCRARTTIPASAAPPPAAR